MPLHDERVRAYEGGTSSWPPPALRLARAELRRVVRHKAFWILAVLALGPFLLNLVLIYGTYRLQEFAEFFDRIRREFIGEFDASFYWRFLTQEKFWLLVVTAYAGSGLIAEDRRSKAWALYFARPLGKGSYVAGKGLSLAGLLLGFTLAPALFLWSTELLLNPAAGVPAGRWGLVLPIGATSLVLVSVLACGMISCSSLTSRAVWSGLLFFAWVFGLTLFGTILGHALREPAWRLLSLLACFRELSRGIFGLEPEHEVVARWAGWVLAGWTVLHVAVAWARIRVVEAWR